MNVDYNAIRDQRQFVCGDLHIRTSGSPLAKGAVITTHKHEEGHASFVMRGSFHVKTDELDAVFAAPSVIWIAAGVQHEIESLEDGSTFWCVRSHEMPR